MRRIGKGILAALLMLTTLLSGIHIEPVFAAAADGEYPISEDAFVRSDKGTTNYSYENITKAHGAQYDGKGYKVLNTKYYPDGRELMSVMKLSLPTQEEIAAKHYDTYEFLFHIFKNADYKKGPQTYHFYYTTDVSWSEATITWNNKPAAITHDGGDVFFDFTIAADKEYEVLSDAEKTIRVDVTDKVEALVQNGVSEITVFTAANDKKDTSLMLHSRESADGSYTAKLIASNNDENSLRLQGLIEECEKIAADGYTTASYQTLQDQLSAARDALASGDANQISQAYNNLNYAKANLVAEFPVLADAYVRSDKGTTSYSYENITSAHGSQYVGLNYKVLSAKRYENGREIIGMMKFNVPSSEWLTQHELDTYYLEFDIFKNPGFNNGDQTYHFYYTGDANWDETTVTWNNKHADIKHDGEKLLCDFVVKQGTEYETMNDAQKHMKIDISEKIKEIADAGHTSITVFVVADKGMETSLMIHTKESADGSRGAKITAFYQDYSTRLATLIAECKDLDEALYVKEGMDALKAVLADAEALDESASALDIHIMYERLADAKAQLVSLADPSDPNNIAYQKPTRTNLSKTQSERVTDGDLNTYWQAQFYPSYVDIDFMETYDITGLKIFTPAGKKVNYTIYGSNDGTDYTRLYQKRDLTPMSSAGDSITLSKTESYRIVRIYMEYSQGENSISLSEVRVYGTPTSTNSDELKQGSLEEILNVTSFEDSKYAGAISTQETIDNVYGIIDRTIGAQYRDWFSFEIVNDNNENDWYEISDKNGKIHIKGNEGLSLTTGLNYYYKNYLNVHISEQTKQVSMPSAIVKVNSIIRKETPYQVRYAFNYCTLSYTFAFFGQDEWQRENDWLALNGVNVVLDLAGQEATWIKFLMNFGYSFDDAKDWLTGPAYYAWQFMDNMEVFGGPVPDGYVKDRLEMARSSQRWKRSLGMQTILQGYAGMVPTNFNEYQKDVDLLVQGGWGGFTRPSMIATDTATYDEYARLFYEAQEFVYGATSDYYAVDPFHEGGKRPADLSDSTIADEVLNSMLEYDKDAVWVVQGWQSNPTNDLLKGMGDRREDHVLVVDLIKYPIASWTKYNKTSYGSTKLDAKEFNGTSWAWGLLANFGGNPSMHGQMEVMVNDIQNAKKTSQHMVGLGIISEAQYDNPVMYDLIFDLAWADDDFNLDNWLQGYINRRYGGTSENARTAWSIMKNANYNHGVRFTNELFGMKSKTPQDYGKQTIPYGAENLESALRLLLEDFDKFKDSECYLYDITEIMRQQVSNYAVLKYNEVLDARTPDTVEEFKALKDEFLNSFEVLNEVASTQQEQLGGEWIGKATDRASAYDDFAIDSFEMGAKALISSWGSRSSHGGLKDYGWRNYEGIFKDLNTSIWSEYLNRVADNLENGLAVTNGNLAKSDYFDIYWKWNLSKQNYTRTAKDSAAEIKAVADRVLAECAISGELDPNIGNVALPGFGEATPDNDNVNAVNDGDKETVLELSGSNAEVIIDLIGEFQLSKINVASNEQSSGYQVYISNDKNTWIKVGEKAAGSEDEAGITYPLDAAIARYVKVVSANDDDVLQLSEVRAYGERILPDLDQLKTLIDFAGTINTDSANQTAVKPFETALADATASYNNGANPDEAGTVYWALYDAIVALDLKTIPNVALNKKVTAHNDPSGNSDRLTDGSLDTHWNAGRLSATGKPYEDTITPGWAIVDLEDLYEISQIQVVFGNNIWHHYEVSISEDNQTWTKIGEKKTNALPGDEDIYDTDNVLARYVKIDLTDVQLESGGKRNSIAVKELIVRGSKFKVNKTELNKAITEAEAFSEAMYTENSWKVLNDALKAAKQAEESEDVSQNEVDTACDELKQAIEQLTYKDADYSKVDKAIQKADGLNADDYIDFSGVRSALDAVVLDKKINEQTAVDAMAKAIEDAIAALEYKSADYTAVDEAIAKAEALVKGDYADFSAVDNAIAAVVRNKKINEQTAVDEMAKAIEDAIAALKYKSADYSAVDQAIAKAEALVKNHYLDFSAVDDAVAAVVRNKDFREQAAVDEMAKAIENAIAALEYKNADYTAVDQAIAKAEALVKDDYMDFSAVDDAVAAVVRDKKINEQTAVDAMASAIDNAIEKLEKKAQTSDLAALQAAIDKAKALVEADYAPSTWIKLMEAVEAAEATAVKEIVSLTEVNQCIENIEAAILGLKPSIDYRTVTNENVTVSGNMEENVRLVVINTVEKEVTLFKQLCRLTAQYDQKYFEDKELLNIYDIKLLKNNEIYFAEGTLLVQVKLQPQWIGRDLEVIYIKDDGTFETVPATITDGAISFSVEHFSYYGIVGSKQSEIDKPSDRPSIKPNDVLKPNDSTLKPNQGIASGVNTGIVDDLSLNLLLVVMCGSVIVAVYMKKKYIKTWK